MTVRLSRRRELKTLAKGFVPWHELVIRKAIAVDGNGAASLLMRVIKYVRLLHGRCSVGKLTIPLQNLAISEVQARGYDVKARKTVSWGIRRRCAATCHCRSLQAVSAWSVGN